MQASTYVAQHQVVPLIAASSSVVLQLAIGVVCYQLAQILHACTYGGHHLQLALVYFPVVAR